MSQGEFGDGSGNLSEYDVMRVGLCTMIMDAESVGGQAAALRETTLKVS